MLTNSSWVYEEPCAEHVLAMMLSLGRRLAESVENQRGAKGWPAAALRAESNLLVGQSTLILGFGAIARRLVELLAPFSMKIAAVRRRVKGDEGVPTFTESELDRLLGEADHVVNVLPGGASTAGYLSRERLGRMKRSAVLYNIGRGGTVDQEAMIEALRERRIAGAYLDVMTPEPLPAEHALWSTPNCWITPHTAGGHRQEFMRLVEHFLNNLGRFLAGQELRDRVV
jgi:phosphoglycerate dehydrogenase-like enzyme